MRKQWLFLIVVLLTSLTLWGCGSSRDSSDVGGGSSAVDIANAELSGNCTVCHTLDVHTQFSALVGQNPDTTLGLGSAIKHDCEDCHGGGQYHRGVGPIPYPKPDAARCAACHDNQVAGFAGWATNAYHDYSDPDAPACISCHKPLELDKIDAVVAAGSCMACHDTVAPTETTVALQVTAAASSISAKVTASMHANMSGTGGGNRTGNNCQRCHTIDGFLNLVEKGIDPTADANYDDAMAEPQVLNAITARALAPTCAACHDHGPLRAVPNWDPNQNGVADQFDLCTACHNYYDNNGDLMAETSHHATSWYRVISSTHYDDPATGYAQDDNIIEGYVIRTTGENPCFDCHGHELRTNTRRHTEAPQADPTYGPTIHTDWANSRHGGALLEAKVYAAAYPGTETVYNAVVAAGRVDGEGYGWSWTHYDWDATNRQSCQRCHTSTGVSNFLTDPVAYDQTANDFSHLVSPNQNEMLYCWGCHVSVDTGELRDPGALTLTYTNGAQASYPDSAGSNVCIACHSGRENGDSIKNDTSTTGIRSFLNSHYLTAGAMLFATGGYEYEYVGADYAITTGDLHQNIGYGAATPSGNADFDAVSDNYTSGPCVTCHFNSSDVDGLDRSHTLSPFTETVAAGTVLNSVCVVCHTSRGVDDSANLWFGKDFTEADFVVDVVAPHKGRMLGAQLALQKVLESKGIFTNFAKYPYFFTDDTYATGFTAWASVYGLAQWKNVMGAAFNLNLIAHDPGATAHNRRYARRLIYDSIDFMDNGSMDGSTNATVTDQAQPYTASALNYIGSRP